MASMMASGMASGMASFAEYRLLYRVLLQTRSIIQIVKGVDLFKDFTT